METSLSYYYNYYIIGVYHESYLSILLLASAFSQATVTRWLWCNTVCITFRFVCYVISQILCFIRCKLVVILLISTWNFDLRKYFMDFYYHHLFNDYSFLGCDSYWTYTEIIVTFAVSQFMEWTFVSLSIWQWLPDAVRRSEIIWTHLILQTGRPQNWRSNWRNLESKLPKTSQINNYVGFIWTIRKIVPIMLDCKY